MLISEILGEPLESFSLFSGLMRDGLFFFSFIVILEIVLVIWTKVWVCVL